MWDIHPIHSLRQMLIEDARIFISGETSLKHVLPEWMQLAESIKLKLHLQEYHARVQEHIRLLEGMLQMENRHNTVPHRSDRVVQALITEASERIGNCPPHELRDVAILSAVQTITHHKISTYGTAATWAGLLGNREHEVQFHICENDEKLTDKKLTLLALEDINRNALVRLREHVAGQAAPDAESHGMN